uniref:RING-type E3 ubiquitin transferase n=1 Tax=Myotis lucifugus TaxID=59463 RepID=G1Q5S0_MYOLU
MYPMHGVCKKGENCRYSHDLSDSPYGVVFKYSHVHGDRCGYEHSKPSKQEERSNCYRSNCKIISCSFLNSLEFVPGQPYCSRTAPMLRLGCTKAPFQGSVTKEESERRCQLCPYAEVEECSYGENCAYLHGDSCDKCGLHILSQERSQHIKSCIEAMRRTWSSHHSEDKVCGICVEVIYEKANLSEHHFWILSKCNHTYCLKCIHKWRSAQQFESKTIKSCPEGRITSNFVIPREYWVEEKEETQKLIQKYEEAMSNKCAGRYFDEGRGSCPFGGNCLSKHAYPDGRREEPQRQKVGSSSRHRPRRRNHFWELIEEREKSNPFDNDEEEVVTIELDEMLLMLLAAGGNELTASEDEWNLFQDELEDSYDLDP